MKILIIDNTHQEKSWGSHEIRRFHDFLPQALFVTRRAPHMDLPSSDINFDGIIISGSLSSPKDSKPWLNELESYLVKKIEANVPIFGICFGHQFLGRTLGSIKNVRNAKTPELGWTKIKKLCESKILKNLPSEFYSLSSHYEEISELPSCLINLAESNDCAIQAYAHKEKPLFGVQFHPEKSISDGIHSYNEHQKNKIKHPFRGGKEAHKYYKESIGQTIFKNFYNVVRENHGYKK